MAMISQKIASALASGAVILALCAPASALDVGDRGKGLGVSVGLGKSSNGGLGVSVGATVGDRSKGINVDSNTTIGGTGGKAVDSKTTASVGGAGGVNAGAKATVGGTSVADAKVGVGVGGLRAGVSATVGGAGGLVDVDIGVGGPVSPGGPIGPGVPGNPGSPSNPGVKPGGVKGTVAGLSSKQLAQFRKRCVDILANPSSYDRSLAQLCQMIRMASR